MVAELLADAPTSTGVFGRETAAACALARGEDPEIVLQLLNEAHEVGSMAAARCLLRLGPPTEVCERANTGQSSARSQARAGDTDREVTAGAGIGGPIALGWDGRPDGSVDDLTNRPDGPVELRTIGRADQTDQWTSRRTDQTDTRK
jgi:hypothetical protein